MTILLAAEAMSAKRQEGLPAALRQAVHDYADAQASGDLAALDRLLADDYACINSRAELKAILQLLRHDGASREAHVWVPTRGELIRVDLHEVDRISAEGAYIRLYIGSRSYLHREPLCAIAARLDPTRFVRVHRSHIVRGAQVAAIGRGIQRGGELMMRDGTRVPVGRKYVASARRQLLVLEQGSPPGARQSGS